MELFVKITNSRYNKNAIKAFTKALHLNFELFRFTIDSVIEKCFCVVIRATYTLSKFNCVCVNLIAVGANVTILKGNMKVLEQLLENASKYIENMETNHSRLLEKHQKLKSGATAFFDFVSRKLIY